MSHDGFDPIINVDQASVEGGNAPSPWAGTYRVLTPQMRAAGGSLGVAYNTLPPGSIGCPFHWHAREDEVFYVVSGRGVLRYGDTVRPIRAGDCISCPAGTETAHQIGNPYDTDLVYLGIGPYDPHEVCGYPDTDKVMVRALKTVGRLEKLPYMADEPDPPRLFELPVSDG